ncbi:MAG: hypothetical protein IJV77_00065 [Clostridia bacterium]|nr:hypothetical protein [Clostridia bacterium]
MRAKKGKKKEKVGKVTIAQAFWASQTCENKFLKPFLLILYAKTHSFAIRKTKLRVKRQEKKMRFRPFDLFPYPFGANASLWLLLYQKDLKNKTK